MNKQNKLAFTLIAIRYKYIPLFMKAIRSFKFHIKQKTCGYYIAKHYKKTRGVGVWYRHIRIKNAKNNRIKTKLQKHNLIAISQISKQSGIPKEDLLRIMDITSVTLYIKN